MMKKRALLIAGQNQDNKNDVENIKQFLLSNVGGGWFSEEISIYQQPQLSDINQQMYRNGDCSFIFIYYSGHGSLDNIPVSGDLFVNWCNRMVIIIDACRTNDETNNLPSDYNPPNLESYNNINLEQCREYYECIILKLPEHKIVVYSTQKNCVAYYKDFVGVFTTELLHTATSCAISSYETKNKLFFSIAEVVNITANILKKKDVIQVPEIDTNSSRNLSDIMPFVINPYYQFH